MSNLASVHLVAPTFLNATKHLLIFDCINAFFSVMIFIWGLHSTCTFESLHLQIGGLSTNIKKTAK